MGSNPTPSASYRFFGEIRNFFEQNPLTDIVKFYYNVKRNFNHGKEYKKYRNKMGISQDKLSKLADITLHTITKIESGTMPDPRIKTIKKIADALNTSIDNLLR